MSFLHGRRMDHSSSRGKQGDEGRAAQWKRLSGSGAVFTCVHTQIHTATYVL